ncbi:MAG: LysM peptidoglycan-binding domain-containing protein, partial [Oligoflexus sp.]
MRGLFLSILISAAVGLAMPVEAQDQPSLEELEQMGEELDQQPAAKSAPASPIAPHPGQPALDTSGLEAVDIRSQIRKVMEANLFAGVPPLPGTLRNMAMGEAPEEYLVQEGDNLYDICDQLLDEPDYWPKLWSLNPDIANPHFVYPGMKLRFYAGDAENPPFLQVVTEDDIVPVNKGGVVEAELVQEDISGMLMRSELPENLEVLDASQLEPMPGIDDMFMSGGGVLQGVDTRLIVPAFIV